MQREVLGAVFLFFNYTIHVLPQSPAPKPKLKVVGLHHLESVSHLPHNLIYLSTPRSPPFFYPPTPGSLSRERNPDRYVCMMYVCTLVLRAEGRGPSERNGWMDIRRV